MTQDLQAIIEATWEDRDNINTETGGEVRDAVDEALNLMDSGQLRVAEPDETAENGWKVNQWAKLAVLLSFRLNENVLIEGGWTNYYDKVPLKFANWTADNFKQAGIRVVPPAVARKGAYIAPGTILMPSYINFGAHIGPMSKIGGGDGDGMIDTWATVGSCAQIGARVHISGGVGIGGVLEPLQANPVIIEDDVFIGARSEVVEGVIVRRRAVLSMLVAIGKNTPIIDRTRGNMTIRGEVPEAAVVMMGAHPEKGLLCPQIVKYRDEQTDAATALTDVLR